MMTKELARELAERLVILGDDFSMVLPPVADTVAVIHETEKELLGGNVDGILKFLAEEIEEYDGDPTTQDHADQAKELYEIIKGEVENCLSD